MEGQTSDRSPAPSIARAMMLPQPKQQWGEMSSPVPLGLVRCNPEFVPSPGALALCKGGCGEALNLLDAFRSAPLPSCRVLGPELVPE